MNQKSLLALSLAALLVIAAWFVIGIKESTTTTDVGGVLFPDLVAQKSQINKIEIFSADNSAITLYKQANEWLYLEKGDFPANYSHIVRLIDTLVDLPLMEAKTRLPENYALIGVEDINPEAGKGVKVTLWQDNTAIASLIVGNYQLKIGTFVRKTDDAQSWQVSKRVLIDTRPADWLKTQLTAYKSNEISIMTFNLPDSISYTLQRENIDADFTITAVDGRNHTLKDERSATLLSELIEDLQPVDVYAIDGIPDQFNIASTLFTTFTDKSILISSWQESDDSFFVAYPFASADTDFTNYRPTWKIAISEPHFKRLNRPLSELAELSDEQSATAQQ